MTDVAGMTTAAEGGDGDDEPGPDFPQDRSIKNPLQVGEPQRSKK